MHLPLGLAKKLQQLSGGTSLPWSQVKHKLSEQMLNEGILQIQQLGRSQKRVFIAQANTLHAYLQNQLGINNLQDYIINLENPTTRTENIISSSDSKRTAIRTFKGFLVNCTSPIKTTLNGQPFTIVPTEGAFTYIHDFEHFLLPKNTLIVGVENAENFRYINQQSYLFDATSTVFVCRYPQSSDLINWLKGLPNQYLHFGDFDFEGLRIFRDEYLQHLGKRATFFIPQNIEVLIDKYGNKDLYDTQYQSTLSESLELNSEIKTLLQLFHNYKKCLEQEVLIGGHLCISTEF